MNTHPNLFPYRGRWPGCNEDGLDLENAGLFTLLLALPAEEKNRSRYRQVRQKWNQVREPRNSEALKRMTQGDSSAGLPEDTWIPGEDSESWLRELNTTLS